MPPWKTTTRGFHGQRGLTETEKIAFKRWAESGAAEGKPETESPKAPTTADWPLGPPDKILTMPKEYTLPAATSEVSRCFVISTGLTEDKWVRAIAFRPSNPRLVRYASVYADADGQGRQHEAISGAVGYFGFASGLRPTPVSSLWDWSPGATTTLLPEGVAVRLPRAADLILQLRFHATGKPETERMQIGLYFAPKAPTVEPITLRLGTAELYLPRQSTATLEDTFLLPTDAQILEIVPNLHFIARTISVIAETPDGQKSDLLQIPDPDAAWKQPYRYAIPPRLPAGTRLTLHVAFDNTEANPRNPWKPSHRVVPGLEFMEEMGSVWLRLLPTNPAEAPKLRAALPPPSHRPKIDYDELEPEGKPARPARPTGEGSVSGEQTAVGGKDEDEGGRMK